jgi:hypothetical protein
MYTQEKLVKKSKQLLSAAIQERDIKAINDALDFGKSNNVLMTPSLVEEAHTLIERIQRENSCVSSLADAIVANEYESSAFIINFFK